MSKPRKRNPSTDDELAGWIEVAKLDSSSLGIEPIGHGDRWRVIWEGEVIDELSRKRHPRLIACLAIIAEEHRAAIPIAAQKLAEVQVTRARLVDTRKKAPRAAEIEDLVQAEVNRRNLGMAKQSLATLASRWGCSSATAYRVYDQLSGRKGKPLSK